MLDAAVERKYSASPSETFYTGGGAQASTISIPTTTAAFSWFVARSTHSVNLVFVRMMRDIVHDEDGADDRAFVAVAKRSRDSQDVSDAFRRSGKPRIHAPVLYEYHGKTRDQALALLLLGVRKSPPKVATVLRSVAPDGVQRVVQREDARRAEKHAGRLDTRR